jgi:hypothetical protein
MKRQRDACVVCDDTPPSQTQHVPLQQKRNCCDGMQRVSRAPFLQSLMSYSRNLPRKSRNQRMRCSVQQRQAWGQVSR